MALRETLRKTAAKKFSQYSLRHKEEAVMVGYPDASKTVVADASGLMIWVTDFGGRPRQVLNRKLPNRWGLKAWVGYDSSLPGREQLLRYDDAYDSATWMGPEVKDHHETHDFGKLDCDWVREERMLDFAIVPGEKKIKVYSSRADYLGPRSRFYPYDETVPIWKWNAEPFTVDFSDFIPTSGAAIVLLAYNAPGELTFISGTAILGSMYDLTEEDFPDVPASWTVLLGLRLFAGMTQAYNEPGKTTFIRPGKSIGSALTGGMTGLHGDVVATGPGIAEATISDGAVTLAKMDDLSAYTIIGNPNEVASAPEEITLTTYATVLIASPDAAEARSTLGIEIGSDVQAYDAKLDTYSALAAGNGYLKNNGAGVLSWASLPVPTTVTVADEAADTSCYIGFYTASSGDLAPKTSTHLQFNSATGLVTLTGSEKINTNSTSAFLVEQTGVYSNIFVIDTTNNAVGFGTSPVSTSQVIIGGNTTKQALNINPTITIGANIQPIRFFPNIVASAAISAVTMINFSGSLDNSAYNVTTLVGMGMSLNGTATYSGTVTSAMTARIATTTWAGGTVNRVGQFVIAQAVGGTASNCNLVLGQTTLPASGNYSIYSSSSYASLLSGALTITGSVDTPQLVVNGFSTQAATPMVSFARTDTVAGISSVLGLTGVGSATAGDGVSIDFYQKSTLTAGQPTGQIRSAWNSPTNASRSGDLSLWAYYTTTAYEGFRVRGANGAAQIGFYGVTPISRPTTGYSAATFAQLSGAAVNDASTFDGYTLTQIVKALRDIGVLT